MRVDLKGAKRTTRTPAGGSKKALFNLRATGAPIHGKPGTPEFMASRNSAAAARAVHNDEFRAIIAKYKASAEFAKLAPKTQKAYLSYIGRIELEFGSMPIAAINDPRSRGDFLEWRDAMSATPRAADYAWTTLARILSWGKNRSLLTNNPCEMGGRLYRGGSRAELVWKPADLQKLMAHASPEVMAAVILALWTGQRQGDLLRLTWKSYNGRTINLRQSKSGGKRVSIPVGETLRRLLDGLERRSPRILVNSRGRPWTEDGFRSSFSQACVKAGIIDLHFHDLRGTTVTRLALSGCSVPEIAAITGHSLKDVEALLDAHYLGGRVELAEQAALKLESRFGESADRGF
jgi:integrase